jgi:hypothetical protein
MSHASSAPSSSTLLRWTTLIIVAANLAFLVVYSRIGELPTMAETMAEYGYTFVPASFVKAMSAILVIAILGFYMVALWPSRRRRSIYNALVAPLAGASALASFWIVAAKHREIGLSMALIAAGVALGAAMFARVASASPSRHSLWLRVPFSLYFGAMTIALLIALAQWMNAGGRLANNALAPDELTAAFLAVTVLVGGYVALRYSEFVYPAVIACGTGAIFVAQRAQEPYVAAAALAVCVGMLVVAGLAAATQARTPRSDARDKPSRPITVRSEPRKRDSWGYQLDGNSSIMRL